MTSLVEIAPAARAQIYAHARAAFPAECCGYVTADGRVVRCTNASGAAPDAFAIDGRELFDLVRSFDSPTAAARVLYHSHPNGRAYFSPTDRALALADDDTPIYPLQHLVVGLDATRIVECAQFAWEPAPTREFVELARWSPP